MLYKLLKRVFNYTPGQQAMCKPVRPVDDPVRVICNRIGHHLAQVCVNGVWHDIDVRLVEHEHADIHWSLMFSFVCRTELDGIERTKLFRDNRTTDGVVWRSIDA